MCAKNTVCLDRILRSNNEEYIKLQEDVRKGNWTKNHVDAINGRLHAQLDDNDNDTTNNPEADYRPSVVVYNKTRFALHNAHMKHVSDALHERGDQRPILLDADITLSKHKSDKYKKKKNLSKAELKYLHSLPDSYFDRTEMGSYLYIGAYVYVTQNLGVHYGIANGTRGKIVGWQFPPGTTFKDVVYNGVDVRLPSAPVECVHVQVTNVPLRERPPFQPEGLPDNVISLPSITRKVENSVEIPADISLRKYVDLTVTQIPLRQAATPTTYGIQGGQLTSFIIAETVPGCIYIQISRGKHGLASLSLKRFLDTKFVNDASPNEDIVAELGRLQGLHDETKERFEKQKGNVVFPENNTPHSNVPLVDREACCESTVETAGEHDAKPPHNPRTVKFSRTRDTDDTDENRAQKRPHITTGTKTPNKCPRSDDMNAKHGWPTSTIIGCSNAQNEPSRIEDSTVTSKRQRRTATTTPSCGHNNKKTGGFPDYLNSDSHSAEGNFLNVHSNEWSQVQTTWATTNDRNTGDRLPGYDESNNGHLTRKDFARLQTNEMLTDEVMREVAIRITEASPTLAFIPSMILEKFTHCVLTVLDKKLHRGHSKDLWADQ